MITATLRTNCVPQAISRLQQVQRALETSEARNLIGISQRQHLISTHHTHDITRSGMFHGVTECRRVGATRYRRFVLACLGELEHLMRQGKVVLVVGQRAGSSESTQTNHFGVKLKWPWTCRWMKLTPPLPCDNFILMTAHPIKIWIRLLFRRCLRFTICKCKA